MGDRFFTTLYGDAHFFWKFLVFQGQAVLEGTALGIAIVTEAKAGNASTIALRSLFDGFLSRGFKPLLEITFTPRRLRHAG